MKVRDYLAAKAISYEAVEPRPTFTARHTAQVTHVRGDDVAKTVVLKARRVSHQGGQVLKYDIS